jgi:hypothetical protein
VKPDLSDWLYCKMLPSSVEQFIIELVAWAGRSVGRLGIVPICIVFCFYLVNCLFLGLKICLIFRMSSSSWYDFFHLDGTHPVKVEPLLKSKVWIIIFLFDYWFKGLGFRMRNILKQKIW